MGLCYGQPNLIEDGVILRCAELVNRQILSTGFCYNLGTWAPIHRLALTTKVVQIQSDESALHGTPHSMNLWSYISIYIHIYPIYIHSWSSDVFSASSVHSLHNGDVEAIKRTGSVQPMLGPQWLDARYSLQWTRSMTHEIATVWTSLSCFTSLLLSAYVCIM